MTTQGVGSTTGVGSSSAGTAAVSPTDLFSAFDTDGDGKITLDELKAGFAKLGITVPEAADRFFARHDRNHDGGITKSEFQSFHHKHCHGGHHKKDFSKELEEQISQVDATASSVAAPADNDDVPPAQDSEGVSVPGDSTSALSTSATSATQLSALNISASSIGITT